ncbi:MAG: hypothetical protein AB1505_04105 [Candidatus Latescibacterota bacterium]
MFRETASNTNERTCIAAVLPPCSAASHTLTGVLVTAVSTAQAACVLNSFAFDWALRLRTAGTHVSLTYILPTAVPAAAAVRALPAVPTRLGWEAGLGHVTEDEAAWPAPWASERAVAEGYGLGPEELAYVLAGFPVSARKRPCFYAYLHERLAEWGAGSAPAGEAPLYGPPRARRLPLAADGDAP